MGLSLALRSPGAVGMADEGIDLTTPSVSSPSAVGEEGASGVPRLRPLDSPAAGTLLHIFRRLGRIYL